MEQRLPSNEFSVKSEENRSDLHGNLDEKIDNSFKEELKQQKKRKKKVKIACVYCRRSHMICDDSRPCQRCIKRGIGHLCYDEPSNSKQRKKVAALKQQSSPDSSNLQNTSNSLDPNTNLTPENPEFPLKSQLKDETNQINSFSQFNLKPNSVLSQTIPYNQEPFFFSEHAGSEFSSLNDFLSMIDDPDLVNGTLNDENGQNNESLMQYRINNDLPNPNIQVDTAGPKSFQHGESLKLGDNMGNPKLTSDSSTSISNILSFTPSTNMYPQTFTNTVPPQQHQQRVENPSQAQGEGEKNNLSNQPVISDSARDKFFLTAADPTTEISPEERLKQVIKAKLEAGLLQPYNYAKGYARLQSYMDNYMNASSRQRVLKPLSIFRPAFRAIARTLKDVDLVLVEESFERMLLDYDRVFTSMAIPACLWRRTGEIYRGNKEFASLVGVTTDDLKDGKLAIYELMSEESAVNFWEKYGAIAFDKGQKAVLTSCNLRTKDGIKRKSCCFSFTIRRDRYNIPSCIVGNFIPIDP